MNLRLPTATYISRRARLACAALLWSVVPAAAQSSSALPPDIQAAIRKDYAMDGIETRYVDGSIDLNADGKSEIIVHVVGGGACGTGGCPTLVFTPDASGYRLVSTITVSNPPVRAAAASSQGWRDLIVHVGGGGTRSRDVELTFDGRSYPGNPTVAGPRVKAASAGGDVVIKPFDSFDQTKPLPASGAAASAAPAAPGNAAAAGTPAPAAAPAPVQAGTGSGPSFDCTKATLPAEKMICGDAGLAALDRKLAGLYTQAMKGWEGDGIGAQERGNQRTWLASNRCTGANAYQRRIAEVQITGGLLMAPTPVEYTCQRRPDEPFTVAFYNDTEPKSAVITMGNRQVVALAVPSGSGARYRAPDVDFWEHQGEAAVTWAKASFTCKPR